MKRAGADWSRAGWHAHVPGADEAFVAELGASSLPELAHRSGLKFANRIAVEFADRGDSITHGQLDADSARVAARLRRRIDPGDRVLLAGAAGVDFLRCYLGLLRAGGVAVLANPAATAAELRHLITDSGAVLSLLDGDPGARRAALDGRSGILTFEELAAGPPADSGPVPEPPGPDDLALLAYTSGTTGRPKGVPLTHRNLVTSIRAAMAAWRWETDDVLVHGLPLFHQHGLGGVHATLIAGSTARLLSRFTEAGIVEAARGATVLFAVPTMYQGLARAPEAARVLGGLRLAVCGSAPLSDALAGQVAAAFGRLPLIRYGTTESGLDVSNPMDAARGDTVGVPLPGVLVRIAAPQSATPEEATSEEATPEEATPEEATPEEATPEEATPESAVTEAPFGVDGEIQICGPQLFAGYWRDPAASAEAFTADGWFRTGDIGHVDPESGHLAIRGRTKELIITGGMNVYPREVEVILEQHPAVAEAAVAGLPHEHWGEQVTAWVVPAGDARVDPAELVAYTRTLLAPYKCPKQVLTVDALPRGPMGKVARAELDTPAGQALRRAEALAGLGAFVELYPDARAAAGTPVAVKDNIDVAGQLVRAGTRGLIRRVAIDDSPVWARLREHGHVPIGRTSLPELAWSLVTPGCRNPWDESRTAGGSSGGSAVAVAAGVVPLALGTDTGGSIRVPAALCGVAGLRPTFGATPTGGITPLAPSMDTIGPIARTAAECLRAHAILGGVAAPAPECAAGLRVGWPAHLWSEKVEPEVRRLVEAAADALRTAGVEIIELELPLARRDARRAGYTIMLAESAQRWWQEYQAHPDGLGERTAALLGAGAQISPAEYARARTMAQNVRAELDEALRDVGALLLPTVAATAAPLDATSVVLGDCAEPVENAYYRLAALAAVTGAPALTVPAGLTTQGLPVGAQLIGAPNQEALLCLLGGAIENGPESRALARARDALMAKAI